MPFADILNVLLYPLSFSVINLSVSSEYLEATIPRYGEKTPLTKLKSWLFSFVLSRRYPGGIVTNDYCFNTTDEIKNVLIETMSNSSAKRPQNGSELLKLFNEATIEK